MPVLGLKKFEQALQRIARDLPREKVILLQKKIALEVLARLVLKTPVDTGRARGNWQVTLEQPARSIVNKESKTGKESIGEGGARIAQLRDFGVIFITNNLPYIEPLERGHSKQARAGMLGPTINELTLMLGSGAL